MANPFLSPVLDDATRPAEDPLDHGGDWLVLGGNAWLGARGERLDIDSEISAGTWSYSDVSLASAWDNGNQASAYDDSVIELKASPATLTSYTGDIFTVLEFGTGIDTTLNVELIQGTTVISHQESLLGENSERPFVFPATDTAAITDFDDLRLRLYFTGTGQADGFCYATNRLLGADGEGSGFTLLALPVSGAGDDLIHLKIGAIMWNTEFGPSEDREVWVQLDSDLSEVTFPLILGFFDLAVTQQITYASLIYPAYMAVDGQASLELTKLPFADEGQELLDNSYDDPTWAAGDILGVRLHSTGIDFYQWDGSFATLWATSSDTTFFDQADHIIIYNIGGETAFRSIGGGTAATIIPAAAFYGMIL